MCSLWAALGEGCVLEEKGMERYSFMTRVLKHPWAGGTAHQLHVTMEPQARSCAPRCGILC